MAASDDENPYRSPRTAAEPEPWIYWGWRSIPELRDLSRKDRARVWRRCALKGFRHWQVLTAFAAAFAIAIAGQFAASYLFGDPATQFEVAIRNLICVGAGAMAFNQVLIHSLRPHLAAEVARRKVELGLQPNEVVQSRGPRAMP